MRTYGPQDIQIVNDPIALLRKLYTAERMNGPYLSARLLHDLVLLDALPVRADRIGSWWLVGSQQDWLRSSDSIVSTRPFHTIVAFPAAGPNTHRAEVMLTAFAVAVVTCGTDGLEWIVRDQDHEDLPAVWLEESRKYEQGRFVAFKVNN
jgi:hypothetical protein